MGRPRLRVAAASALALFFVFSLATRGACFMDRISRGAANASHDCCGAGLRAAAPPCCAAAGGPEAASSPARRLEAAPVAPAVVVTLRGPSVGDTFAPAAVLVPPPVANHDSPPLTLRV